jgi:hypothetical protein
MSEHEGPARNALESLAEAFEALNTETPVVAFTARVYKQRATVALALRALGVLRDPSDHEARQIGFAIGGSAARGFAREGRAVCAAIVGLAEKRTT